MIAGSVLLAMTMIGFAAWLQWNESQNASDRSNWSDRDRSYFKRRARMRWLTHLIIALCGVIILISSFSGAPIIWLVGWSMVMLMLLVVIVLALMDGLRTHLYQKRKLPELRQSTMLED